jgi:hypothetical protein
MHRVTAARLVWAASTIRTAPYGTLLPGGYSLEVEWRSAMLRSSLDLGSPRVRRSSSYDRLDPSEKGAVSFFLGQAQAKVFARDFFGVARMLHYDAYLRFLGRPLKGTRPDYVGYRGSRIALAVEAKGRSNYWDAETVVRAKKQVRSLPAIRGYRPTRYAHLAYFDNDSWCAYLEDPPAINQSQTIDPEIMTSAYYYPIVQAIRQQGGEPEYIRWQDTQFLIAEFPRVDVSIMVQRDIAELSSESLPHEQTGTRQISALHALALTMDENGDMHAPQSSDPFTFVGQDGVGVRLGRSWSPWVLNEADLADLEDRHGN